jgi:hypothetical protein
MEGRKMMKKVVLILVLLGLLGFNCFGNNDVPVAISPGMAGGVGVVENRCPTFSWSGVSWAQNYRVVVFGVEDVSAKIEGEVALTAARPLLSEDIAGGGLSWTPSVSQGLAEGADYTWQVGAMDSSGAWAWSEPRRFRVEASSKQALVKGEKSDLKGQVGKDEASGEATLQSAAGFSQKTVTGKKGKINDPGPYMGSEGALSTFYGTGAGANNLSDNNDNSFFGSAAGYTTTSGFDNTFMGFRAGRLNSTGSQNAFLGAFAGENNTTGIGNSILGYHAGHTLSTGIGNIFLGSHAGANETGSYKLYIDDNDTSSPLIYGDFSLDNVGINGWLGVGTQMPAYPMELKTSGRAATFVASRSGGASNFINATDTYGQFGTVNNYAVRILVNSSPRLTLNADNGLAMASGASCTAGGVWQNASSRALKENIVNLRTEDAVATLKDLNPVRFTYKADKSDEQVGFIAEDVPELVATKDRKSLSPMDIVAVLTKVTQEQQKTIENLTQKMQEQQKAISALNSEVSELKKKSAMEK